jgi:fumarylpyruvate hydrolase
VSAIGHPASGTIALTVAGVTRQTGDLAEMIWNVPEVIAHLSSEIRLEPGDLIYTGTPAGVSAVKRGDVMIATIAGIGELAVEII